MNDLLTFICTILHAITDVVVAVVTVINCVREGKRRRKHEKTGKHSRP